MKIYDVVSNSKVIKKNGNSFAFASLSGATDFLKELIKSNSDSTLEADTDILTIEMVMSQNPVSIVGMSFTKFKFNIRTIEII